LKERDLLLSEKAHLKRSMPNRDRIGKVKVSMARLKTVIGERTRIYKDAQLKIAQAIEQNKTVQ